MSRAQAAQSIEYFYSAHSAFAYLGSRLLIQIAAQAGCAIAHKPMDLRAVVAAGGAPAIASRSAAHRAYYFGREIERWSEYREAPVMNGIPTHHANDITRVNCLLIAAQLNGENIDELAHALLQAHWRDDADLDDPVTLTRIATDAGYDALALLANSDAPEVRARYAANTEEAIARHVFGSPTYVVGGDPFYGQDHLELVARALRTPFA